MDSKNGMDKTIQIYNTIINIQKDITFTTFIFTLEVLRFCSHLGVISCNRL